MKIYEYGVIAALSLAAGLDTIQKEYAPTGWRIHTLIQSAGEYLWLMEREVPASKRPKPAPTKMPGHGAPRE